MRAIRKLVVWSAVFATILLAFGTITYVVAQPIALVIDRAAWSVGLSHWYGTLPSHYLNLFSWALATFLCTALLQWLGALGTQPSVSHRPHGVSRGATAPAANGLLAVASR